MYNLLSIIYVYYVSPVCHLPFNFAYGVYLDIAKILFLSDQIHSSFPLLFLLRNV